MRNFYKSNAAKNLISGMIAQIVTVCLGLVIPRLVLESYGSEVNGLLNSTAQFFAYIALLEAGVGTATLQALYKPISANRKEDISSIMAATHRYYQRTGIIYFACVLLLSVLYPLCIDSEIDPWLVLAVVLLQGMTGVLNYLFSGKFRIMLQAEGKNHIITNLSTIAQIFTGFGKVIVLQLGFNVVAVQLVAFAINLMQTAFILTYIKKRYTWLDLKAAPNYKAISKKNDVLVGQIAGLVHNNTDVILLTIFQNLSIVSVYSVYLMLCNMINSIIDTISSSITHIFGRLFATNFNKFKLCQELFEQYYLCCVFWLYSVVYVFITPFIAIYTRGITDIDYMSPGVATAFVVMEMLAYALRPYNQVITLAQHFKQIKWISVSSAVLNLSISLLLVHKFGIIGVLLGSIAAELFKLVTMIAYGDRAIMKRSTWKNWCRILINMACFAVITMSAKMVFEGMDSYVTIFLCAAVMTILSGAIFFCINTAICFQTLRKLKNLHSV